MRPDAVIDACRIGHRRLLQGIAALSEDDFRAPSELPRWSRAHVIAHVINKTEAHVWLFGGPAEGEVRQLYPAGYDQHRAADAGAGRTSTQLRSDLEHSFDRLEQTWDALDDDALWGQQGIMTAGPRTMAEIVSHHLRDVEVHHVDLDIGYRVSDWPSMFVEGELAKRLHGLPDRADHADLLAWLLDRAAAPNLGPW